MQAVDFAAIAPVAKDPLEDPGFIVAMTLIGLLIAAVVLLVVVMVWRSVKRSLEESATRNTGAPARARIIAIEETGVTENDRPEVRMILEVHLPGSAPYQVEHTTIVSLLAIPRVQPGCTLDIRVNRANPTRVAIVGL